MESLDDFQTLVKLAVEVHRVEDLLTPSGGSSPITPLQHAALRILYFEGQMTLGGLAQCMGVSLPNGSREVKHLTSLGLAVKLPDPKDKRLVRISLTATGREAVEDSFRDMEDAYRRITGNWLDTERREASQGFVAALGKLVKIKE